MRQSKKMSKSWKRRLQASVWRQKSRKRTFGPAVTKYEIQPAVGVKVSKIVSLGDDLALALAAKDIRIEAPIPVECVLHRHRSSEQ